MTFKYGNTISTARAESIKPANRLVDWKLGPVEPSSKVRLRGHRCPLEVVIDGRFCGFQIWL